MRGVRNLRHGFLLGIWGLVFVAPANAEPNAAPEGLSALADEKARQTFKEGIEAFDRRDFEAARIAFLQTFALKPSVPVVRRNLGLSEIFSGHYLDGARRLARVIHTTGDGTAEDRARMLDSLKKAEAHLERITIEVNVDGADILVDEVDLGSSPLPFVWYVAPGAYRVHVSKPGFSEFSQTRVARAGSVQHLRVALTAGAEREAVAVGVAPRSAPPLDVSAPGGPNPWIVGVGAVAAAGGLAAGIAFSLAASSNSRKVDEIGGELGVLNCTMVPPPSDCRALAQAADAHDRQVKWAAVSFVGAGVAGLGTLLYVVFAQDDAVRNDARRAPGQRQGLLFDLQGGRAALGWQTAF